MAAATSTRSAAVKPAPPKESLLVAGEPAQIGGTLQHGDRLAGGAGGETEIDDLRLRHSEKVSVTVLEIALVSKGETRQITHPLQLAGSDAEPVEEPAVEGRMGGAVAEMPPQELVLAGGDNGGIGTGQCLTGKGVPPHLP